MGSDGTPPEKKDLTGIMDLPQLDPTEAESDSAPVDPFAVNESQPIEQISSFESIEEIGMMDHPSTEAEPASVTESEPSAGTVFEDPFANTESAQANSFESEFSTPTETVATPMVDAPFETPAAEPLANFSPQDFAQPDLNAVQAQTKPVIEGLRSYSEKSKESAFDPGTRNPYHLIISGPFDPFSRDKLLVFITENSVGISSSDLDFQINAGKVLFPRVSEFSAIKLTQDLRDTGLTFQVFPSSRDEDEMIPGAQSLRFEYRESSGQPKSGHGRIPVLPLDAAQNNGYKIIDSIQMVQYLRAEILEVEKSDLFQELLDRMTNALKRRAEAKGAEALTSLAHKVTALRLPSQYQVELSATLLKKL